MPRPERLEPVLSAQQQQRRAARDQVDRLRGNFTDDQVDPTRYRLEVPSALDCDELRAASHRYHQTQGRADLEIEDLLDAVDLDLLGGKTRRLGWTTEDVVAVGFRGLAGALTAILADTIDAAVVDKFGLLEPTEFISRW